MIFHAIDEDGLAPDVLQDACHVGVQAGAEFRVFEKRNTVLRAEDDMQDDAGEGLRHNGARSLRPDGALPIPYFQTQGGARSSLALGWLVDGPLTLPERRLRHYVCPECGMQVGNREVAMKRLNDWLRGERARPRAQFFAPSRKTPDLLDDPSRTEEGRTRGESGSAEAGEDIGCDSGTVAKRHRIWDALERKFASDAVRRQVEELHAKISRS